MHCTNLSPILTFCNTYIVDLHAFHLMINLSNHHQIEVEVKQNYDTLAFIGTAY